MKLVADAEEEIVGALEGREVVGAEVVLRGKLVDLGDVELHAGHPHGVLVIAQATHAVLDVGFLVEDGVGILGAPVGLILDARGDVVLRVLGGVVAAVGLREGVVEFLRTRDAPRLQHRRLGLDVFPRLGERFVNRASDVADLEAAVPEDVENLGREVLL